MLAIKRTVAQSAGALQRRTFVSPVLLNRSWEKYTVPELKAEARSRGLPIKGTKSSLVTRLLEHEKSISSSAAIRAEAVPVTGEAPGVPPAHEFQAQPPDGFMTLRIPEPADPTPEIETPIPFVPDFWTSSPAAEPAPEITPKIVVVGGAETHIGGGPTHSTIPTLDSSAPAPTAPTRTPGQGGFWDDATESLNLPYAGDITSSISNAWSSFKASLK
ncbi:hypothetical protein CYLTODRAFT_418149 [Cylindrobasidium torrendii FP15055 ss-10]|uniref:SAP domain-containing protein n=1 Tax=Cylindrobasidium torrendii FP15055 ss-10 TaxID=1314674 RepID=A0A0D7BP22_9AGAR|nr:hypothetical protein CYLTODRAFT_418149 [Cylindrobasidium torrendii FP15055 ss-10]